MLLSALLVCWDSARAQQQPQEMPGLAQKLFAYHNQFRADNGLPAFEWDSALAAAAMKHCYLMLGKGPIAHQYPGEADLAARAATAGARFSLIEENIILDPDFQAIFRHWLDSPPHRANIASSDVNRIGIAVIELNGYYYSVVDFARGSEELTAEQIEAKIAALILTLRQPSGLSARASNELARQACATSNGLPDQPNGDDPEFVMRWQNADIDHLPPALVQRLRSGKYRQFAVGSCRAAASGGFTVYRLAVLLY
jgi:hypothetical protein